MTRCNAFSAREVGAQGETLGRPVACDELPDGVAVCAGCGQVVLSSPDDPMPRLWCDTCVGGVK